MWAWLRSPISVNVLLLGVILPAPALAAPPDPNPRAVPSALHDQALAEGEVRVLVELALPSGRVTESVVATQARAAFRQEIADTGARVLSGLAAHPFRVLRQYQTSPLMALSVGPAALKELESSSLPIKRVMADRLHKPVLMDSVPLIGADQAWAAGFDGTGKTVAVIDSGVDSRPRQAPRGGGTSGRRAPPPPPPPPQQRQGGGRSIAPPKQHTPPSRP